MNKKFTVQHTGYPVAGRPIDEREWKNYSDHASLIATYRAIKIYHAHLTTGTWDDHYRVITPDGEILSFREVQHLLGM